MTALLFLAGAILWLVASFMLARRIPSWMGATKYKAALSFVLFPVVLAAPIADDLIGRWQFYRLCDTEAVITVGADADKVKRARESNSPITTIEGYAVPISVQRVELVDLDTMQPFLTVQAFHTKGGILQRHFYGLGSTKSCWPKDVTPIMNRLHTDALIKQGNQK